MTMQVHVVQHISLSKHHLLGIAKLLVAGNEDAIARLQSFKHFVLLRILSAYGDRHSHRLVARFVEAINPAAACHIIEVAARNDNGFFRFAELNLYAVTLSHTGIVGHVGSEGEFGCKGAVLDLGNDAADAQRIFLALIGDRSRKPCSDAVDIVFAERHLYLIGVEHLDVGDSFARTDALAYGSVDKTELTAHGCSHNEVGLALKGALIAVAATLQFVVEEGALNDIDS